MTPVLGLPRCLAIRCKSTGKYLRYEDDGVLKFSGEKLMDARHKFQVELAKASDPKEGLIHLRSCYNNKYCRRASENNQWIAAAAAQPEEDQAKWSCTLFKAEAAAELISDPTKKPATAGDGDDMEEQEKEEVSIEDQPFRVMHVQLHRNLSSYPVTQNCYAGGGGGDIQIHHKHDTSGHIGGGENALDLFTAKVWDALFMLPRHVAFKGDNGRYLRASAGNNFVAFEAEDATNITTAFTTSENPSGGGTFRIMSNFRGGQPMGASQQNGWVELGQFPNSWYVPIHVEGNVVALRRPNEPICRRFSDGNILHRYRQQGPTVIREARVELRELVLSRSIYNLNYRLGDAFIYDRKILVKASGQAVNTTKEATNVDMSFSYEEVRSSEWNSHVSTTVGVTVSLRAGIPFIARGKIEVSTEISGGYEWGGTKVSTSVVATTHKVTVPAKSKIRVVLMATEGYCDVPFTYTRRDLLQNGEVEITTLEEGVYSGINTYDFRYETHKEPLDPEDFLIP